MLPRLLGSLVAIAGLGVCQVNVFPQTASLNAQQPNAATKRYPVSGTVVNSVTGAPVARAVVRLQGLEPAQTFTSEDGHFELKDVPEGRAFLFAERPGFQAPTRSPQQQVTVSSATSSVQLKLVPQSSLRGRVRNNDGDPLEGLQVQLFRRQVIDGFREWAPANMATTDETGAFEIDDLAPGAYFLQTRPHRVFSAASSFVVDGRHFPDLYPGQYYPNAPDRASAQPIQIQPGADAEADFALSAVPSYSASGIVANTRNLMLSCENPDGEIVGNGVRFDRNGTFTLMQLPSGPCTLRARTGGKRGEGDTGYAELPINIGSADVSGLQLTLEVPPDIPLVISGNNTGGNPGGASASNARSGSRPTASEGQLNTNVNVQLLPRQFARGRGMLTVTQKAGGQVFTSVSPGNYRVRAQIYGASGSCLGSISSGSTDLLRFDLTVSPGGSAAPIEVVLRKDCGSLTLKVEGPNANDPISLVLVPDGVPSQAKTIFLNNGTAQIPDLTPGDYTVYAPPDVNDFAYADPETLKGMQGQRVTVGPNAQASIQIQLPSTSGVNQ